MAKSDKYKRSLANYLIDPNFQIKYAMYFAMVGMTAIGILFTIMTVKMNAVSDVLPQMHGDAAMLEQTLLKLTYDISLFMLITLLLSTIISIGFAIYVTHRVSGAAFVIERFIKEIEEGNYDGGRDLRKSDDLQSIMAALQSLALKLKAKKT